MRKPKVKEPRLPITTTATLPTSVDEPGFQQINFQILADPSLETLAKREEQLNNLIAMYQE